jgi:hypothetical protein
LFGLSPFDWNGEKIFSSLVWFGLVYCRKSVVGVGVGVGVGKSVAGVGVGVGKSVAVFTKGYYCIVGLCDGTV